MSSNSKKVKKTKTIKFLKGCYVHKLKNKKLDPCRPVFECTNITSKTCEINNLFSNENVSKYIKTSIKNLIPQTVVYYHEDCTKHVPLINDDGHPENPRRVSMTARFLKYYGLLDKCVVLYPREATNKQLLLTHTQSHITSIESTTQISIDYNNNEDKDDVIMSQDENKNELSDDNNNNDISMRKCIGWFTTDTFYNQHSSRASKLACGAAIGLIKNIIMERCINGIAIIRPPGHHCERDKVMGFCLYNNVAVAVNVIKQRNLCKKILIVDWDLHHGNGTQNMFINDNNVLYFSVHRHDNGFFYPSTGTIKEDGGNGYNVNVPLNKVLNGRYGDAAYMDIWKCILIPIAMEFKPEIIIISAGFDACIEDPINGNVMAISPPCYGVLCRMLMNVCSKVAVILEGGYELSTMAPAIAYVTWALLRGSIDNLYEYQNINTYNESEIKLYVENTLWYKSIFFEYEFKRFVLQKIINVNVDFDQFYKCNKEYDIEQQQDVTKLERRRIMTQVLTQHRKYWSCLNVLWKYFVRYY